MCYMGDVLIVGCIAGLEIMHLFVCDLLGWGSAAQIIFETKTQEEFKHSIVVTPMAKKFIMKSPMGFGGKVNGMMVK